MAADRARRDICQAVTCALDSPVERVNGEVMNVRRRRGELPHRDLAAIGCRDLSRLRGDGGLECRPTTAAIRVSFRKIRERMPAYRTQMERASRRQELYELFQAIDMPPGPYKFRAFTR